MKRLLAAFGIVAAMMVFEPVTASAASVVAKVDLSSQTMTVTRRGKVMYRWKVSTARRGKVTPTGSWTAKWLSRHHRSSRYNGAPMPYMQRLTWTGTALHTGYVTGRPASHGCVRLHPDHAARLYSMVQQYGPKNTSIKITH